MIESNENPFEDALNKAFGEGKRSRRLLKKSLRNRPTPNVYQLVPRKKPKKTVTQDDDSDDDLKIISCIDPIKWFFPVNKTWQKAKCEQFNLILKKELDFKCDDPVPATTPSEVHDIDGDGNCYFRCLSYLITGSDKSHPVIRDKLVTFMRDNKQKIEGLGGPNYLEKSLMWTDGMWPTEVEIYASACMLDTDIYTYMDDGKWLRFSSSGKLELSDKVERAIYLQNTESIHYDVVVGVSEPKLLHPNRVYRSTRSVQHKESKSIPIVTQVENTESPVLTLELPSNQDSHTIEAPRFPLGPKRRLDLTI